MLIDIKIEFLWVSMEGKMEEFGGDFFFSSGGSLFGKLSMMGLVDQKITGEEEEWRGKLEYESLRLFSRVGLK